jgi:uridine monophosphate synthetase
VQVQFHRLFIVNKFFRNCFTVFLGFLFCSTLFCSSANTTRIIQQLHQEGIILHGNFTLKNGNLSPIYVDLRAIISTMDLLKTIAQTAANISVNVSYDRLCGVPYGAVPLATAVALETGKPLIMVRKEIKQHGLQKLIEGNYKQGDVILLVEDVITSGSSILETITQLEAHGLVVKNVLVILDRQEGGVERLQKLGYNVISILQLS